MARLEKSIEIRAPPEEVWEMLAWDKLPEWDEGTQKNVKSVEYISEVNTPEDKFRVGASARMILNNGEMNVEIRESVENEKVSYRVIGGPFGTEPIVTYILEPVGEGTKITFVGDYEMPWGVFGKFLDRLFKGSNENELKRSLESLKSILEK